MDVMLGTAHVMYLWLMSATVKKCVWDKCTYVFMYEYFIINIHNVNKLVHHFIRAGSRSLDIDLYTKWLEIRMTNTMQ